MTSTAQTAELGTLTTTIAYLTGFQTRTTNPNGNATTVSFQAFDTPDISAPVSITAPEGVTTSIARDVFGKPLTLTRAGLYAGLPVSATRTFVYDPAQRLCKRIEPESGATVFAYDAAGNLAWHAEGSGLTSATCDRASVPIGERIARTYDARDRLLSLSPPGAPATLYGYDLDGALTDLVQGESAWHYTYNKRRLLTGETLSFGDGYAFAYTYTPLAHLSSVTTPSGLSVGYAPNALGQPTKAGTFATGASYFPDGSVKSFTYGNGLVRTVTQNARGLPANVKDALGSTVVHEFGYGFDPNGNVTTITDTGQAGLQTRTLSYDTRDRLVGATATQLWGTAAYAYDPLDNLRVADQGSRQHRYTYDPATWRLSTLTTPAGGLVADFAYDGKGNQVRKGSQIRVFDGANRIAAIAGEAYAYDGNGRRTATWKADGSAKVEVYTQDGKLGFVVDSNKGGGSSFVYLGGLRIAEDFWRCDTGTRTASYFHADILGSPVAETDANRTVLTRTHYAPYGEALNRTVDGPGYTGHVQDAATGLVYAQQRYYDPIVGRFLSIDPVAADPGTGGNFNRYWYANNNPYRFTDPDGRAPDFFNFLIGKPVDSVGPSRELNKGVADSIASAVKGATLEGVVTEAGRVASGAAQNLSVNIDTSKIRVNLEGVAAKGVGIQATKNLANGTDSVGVVPVGEGLFAGLMAETTVASFQLPGAGDSPISFEVGFDVGAGGAFGATIAVDPAGKADINVRGGVGLGAAVKTFTPVITTEVERK